MQIHPAILCGGSGTRLWPMSRGGYPTRYLKLAGDHTLVQQTALRLTGIANVGAPIVLTNHEQRFLLAEQTCRVGVTSSAIVLEPAIRNAAVAIAVAALLALRETSDALLPALPANHMIGSETAFNKAVVDSAQIARDGYLVTFGITPTEPNPGYGYLRSGQRLAEKAQAFAVDAFLEKPDVDTARRYLTEGGYYWNSGMLMLKASTLLEELRRYKPEVALQAERSLSHAQIDNDFTRLEPNAFMACPDISIDHTVMERTQRAAVLAVPDLGWSDIDSWTALADIAPRDAQGNVLLGDVLSEDVTNSFIRSDHRLVAAIGLDNVVIVETADAVLVAHRDEARDVKKIVAQLNEQGRHESVAHRRVVRPWGSYEGIYSGERFQVKRIVVSPGAQLSLQMHHHRAEHWIVVKGTALVTNRSEEIMLTENQSIYIPLGVAHRLINPGMIPLELIEVQSGAYLGEDDIVRFEDTYGRVGVRSGD